jgi:hypothetical protein
VALMTTREFSLVISLTNNSACQYFSCSSFIGLSDLSEIFNNIEYICGESCGNPFTVDPSSSTKPWSYFTSLKTSLPKPTSLLLSRVTLNFRVALTEVNTLASYCYCGNSM